MAKTSDRASRNVSKIPHNTKRQAPPNQNTGIRVTKTSLDAVPRADGYRFSGLLCPPYSKPARSGTGERLEETA